MTDEEWRPVLGYEGYYEVSNRGRVRSLDRIVPHAQRGTVRYKGGIKKQTRTRYYLQVTLARGNGKVSRNVHTLVLEAFTGPRPTGTEACHYDGDGTNNDIGNLRWDTSLGNAGDRTRLGRTRASITHCPQGHPYSGDNLIRVRANGNRGCRACKRATDKKRYRGKVPRDAEPESSPSGSPWRPAEIQQIVDERINDKETK